MVYPNLRDKGYDWIWEDPEWTDFQFDRSALDKIITAFDFNNQITLSNSILFENSEDDEFVVEIQGLEAIKTSEIEGETYDLPEIIHSLRSGFNILANTEKENGNQSMEKRRQSVSAMMVDLYKNFRRPLTEKTMNHWNSLLTISETGDNRYVGRYRDYAEQMSVGNACPGSKPDFIAPPSSDVPRQMANFIEWFNDTGKDGKNPLHPLIRSALAHLYFVTIHPYDDGNGRIARALSVKVISEANKEPTLISLSHAISDDKGEYYKALQQAQRHGNVDAWLQYFCQTAVKAQEITKAKLYQTAVKRTVLQKYEGRLNTEQIAGLDAVITGKGVKQEGIISVKEYVNRNIESLRVRARQEDKSFKEIAQEDIQKLVRLGLLKKSKRNDCEKFVFKFPTIHGITQVIPKKTEEKENMGLNCNPLTK